MFQMKHLPSSVVQWEIKWNFAINYCTTDNGWCFIWNKFWLENKLHKYCLVHQTNNNNSIKIIYNNHNHRASSVPIFPIFPIFCNFPYIFLFNSKTPYNPYNVRLKRQKGILAESCKTDSAHLAFVLSMELIFKKFLCFFQSEGPLINLLRYEMCKLLKLLMDCFLKRDWEESPADSRVFQVRQPTVKFTNRSGWKYSLCPV